MRLKTNIVNEYDNDTLKYEKTIDLVAKGASKILKIRWKLINVILVNSDEIKRINREYRDKDYETDVISFPNDEDKKEIGDIFISIPKAISQAKEYGHSFERELGFLTCHGILHCLGYDHMTQEEEKIMFDLQNKILDYIKLSR